MERKKERKKEKEIKRRDGCIHARRIINWHLSDINSVKCPESPFINWATLPKMFPFGGFNLPGAV